MDGPILLPSTSPSVFISSRLDEFAAERMALAEMITRVFKFNVYRFEGHARRHPPRDTYKACLEQSQFFIGLYGTGYGWVDSDSGMTVSGIHDEWRLAYLLPRLAFVRKTANARETQLVGLLGEIGKSVSYATFESTEELLQKAEESLWIVVNERILASVQNTVGEMPDYAAELVGQYAGSNITETKFLAKELPLAVAGHSRLLIHGLPGTGKTVSLATLAAKHPSVYLSLRSRSRLDALSYLANRLAVLGKRKVVPLTSIDAAKNACEVLLRIAPAMVLVDDIDQNPDVACLLFDLAPGKGKVVFAGRKLPPQLPADMGTLECKGFTQEEVEEYLSRLVPTATAVQRREAVSKSQGNPLYLKYFCSAPSEDPASSLDAYHGRMWKALPANSQEILALLALSQRPISIVELAQALSGYRGKPVSAIETSKELDACGDFVSRSPSRIMVFHPAFREHIQGELLFSGLSQGVHRALAMIFTASCQFHFSAHHRIHAGDGEAIYERLPDAEGLAFVAGQALVARSILAAIIRIARLRGDLRQLGYAIYRTILWKHASVGDQSALRTGRLAEKVFMKAGEKEWALISRATYAVYLVGLARGAEAVGILREAVGHWREAGVPQAEALARTNLGFAYLKLGMLEECGDECREAKALHARLGDKYGYATCLSNQCTVFAARWDNAALLAATRELFQLVREHKMPRLEAAAFNFLAIYYRRKHQYGRAEAVTRKAISLGHELADTNCVATNIGNLGNIFRDQNRYGEARECYEQLESIGIARRSPEHVAMAKTLFAVLAEKEGDLPKALDLGNQAILAWQQLANTHRLANEQADQAHRHLCLSSWKEAAILLEQSARNYSKAGLPKDSLRAYYHATKLYLEHFKKCEAAILFEEALKGIASPRFSAYTIAFIKHLAEWGVQLRGYVKTDCIREAALSCVSRTVLKDDLLELVRSVSTGMKCLSDDSAHDYLRFLIGLVDLCAGAPWDDLKTALAIGVEQIPNSVEESALTNLYEVIGNLGPEIAYRHEAWFGDQWFVVFDASNAPIAEIRSRAETLNERVAAAVAAIVLWRNQKLLERGISSAGWKNIAFQVETLSEHEFRGLSQEAQALVPDTAVFLAMFTKTGSADNPPAALVVGNTYLSRADYRQQPDNHCMVGLSLQIINEAVCHFTNGMVRSQKLARLRRKAITDMLDVSFAPRRGKNMV